MKHCALFLFCLTLAIVIGGCGLLGKSGPEEARLQVEGEAGQQLRLITSTFFLTNRIQDITDNGAVIDSLAILLFDADTSIITLPFNNLYDISSDQRFYVRLNRFMPEDDGLEVRVWVDDDLKFESQPVDQRDSVQFIYNFRGAPGQDIVEL